MAHFSCFKYSIILLFNITLILAVARGQATNTNRIVNGEIAQITKHPYVVAVHRRYCSDCFYQHVCGGTIFNADYVITAANCVDDAKPHDILIVAGSSFRTGFLKDGGMIFPVSELTTHPDVTIDLALVRLALKLPLGSSLAVQAVNFATATPAPGALGVIVGWGRIAEGGIYSEELREATLTILAPEQCQSLKDNEICSGHTTASSGACQGDKGGPLLVNGHMVGVTSRDYGCGDTATPGVYTNVVKLRNWIVGHVVGLRVDFL